MAEKKRQKHAPKRVRTVVTDVAWELAPWHLGAKEVQKHLGCGLQAVYAAANRLGKPLKRARRGFASEVNLSSIDWRKRNVEIAAEVKKSREWVRVLRQRHAPEPLKQSP